MVSPGRRLVRCLRCGIAQAMRELTALCGLLPLPQLTELAKFTDHPNPAVTRILFTPNDMLARD